MDTGKKGEIFPSVATDTSSLPYRIRTKGLALFSAVLSCAVGIGADAYLAVQLLRNADHSQTAFVLVVALCALAVGAFWSYGLFLNLVPHLVLLSDRLEQRSLRGWRILMRSDIEGVRSNGKSGSQATFEIVPVKGKGPAVLLRGDLRKDPVVARWLLGAPSLKPGDDDTAAVLADPRFGATPEERQAMLDKAKGFSVAFFLACLVGSLSFIFMANHRRAELVLAISALVIGALWLQRSQGFLWLVARRTKQSVSGLVFPALVLGLTATEDIHLIGGMTLVWIAGGIALAFLVALAARNSAWWLALPLVPAGGFLIYGLAATADVVFAPPGARVFPLLVNDMYESGKKNTTYHLQVASWDDQPPGPVSTSVDYYYKVRVGSLVCVFRHRGALGIDWYEVNDCPPGSSAPPAVLADFAAKPHKALPPTQAAPPATQSPSGPVYSYPERAQNAGKEGRAVVHCEVANGSLIDCRIKSEDPPGYGFGKAAVGRVMGTDGSGGLQIKPGELKGRAEVDIPVTFKLTN